MKSSRVVHNTYTVDQKYYELIKNEEGLKFSAVVSHYLCNSDGSVSTTSVDRDSVSCNNHQPFETSKELDEWLSSMDNIWNIYYRIECLHSIAEKLGLGEEYILANIKGNNYLMRFDCKDNIEYYTEQPTTNPRFDYWSYAFRNPDLANPETYQSIKKLPRVYGKFEDVLRSYHAMQELIDV